MTKFKNKRRVRCGVIGYGAGFAMGKMHLDEMKRVGMAPTVVCEVDESRLKVATDDFPGIETYMSVSEMLRKSDVNLIAIITPHNTHAKLALQCLRAKRHVVCEKPMAVTTAECDRMIATAKANRVMLSAFHNRHWDGCLLQALKVVRRGTIGEVVRAEARIGGHAHPGEWWRSSKSISGGILYDWGVHYLEYGLQIINAPVVEVSGFAHTKFWSTRTRWQKDTNEDEATAIVRFKNGARLTVTATSIDTEPITYPWVITGTKGVHCFNLEQWETIRKVGRRTLSERGMNPPSQWQQYYRNVANHLTHGDRLIITAEWARRPIHIIDLAGQSAQRGKSLKVKYM